MAESKQHPSRGFRTWLWEWAKSIAFALVVWLFLRTFLIEAFRIPSGSMENTLLIGDFLFVNKLLYGAEVPLIHKRLPAESRCAGTWWFSIPWRKKASRSSSA
jgi:signal peptidase I